MVSTESNLSKNRFSLSNHKLRVTLNGAVVYHEAEAIKIQSLYRGYKTRKEIFNILSETNHEYTQLESQLNSRPGHEFDWEKKVKVVANEEDLTEQKISSSRIDNIHPELDLKTLLIQKSCISRYVLELENAIEEYEKSE